MLKLCLTVILLGCVTQINCENLPVFIWGQKTLGSFPALSQLNGDEFVTLVKSQSTKETLTVVFVENSLSVEDLSQCRLKTETCFTNLRKVQHKTYLTAVDDPVEALKDSYGEKSQGSIYISADDDFERLSEKVGNKKLLFVHFDSVESNEDEDYANHDELMNQFYNVLASKHENVIAIYTARHPSFVYSKPLIRKTRQAKQDPAPVEKITQHFKNVENKVLIAFTSLTIAGKEEAFESLVFTLNDTTNEQADSLIQLEIKGAERKVGMEFKLSGGTWYVDRFYLDGKRFHGDHPVSAYNQKSFGCINVTATDGTNHFSFVNIQLQPEFGLNPNITAFSNWHNDCTGFFSPAIWGALFVIIILAMILSCGLTAIMDIKTMDRFDDPKGKTITINAQE